MSELEPGCKALVIRGRESNLYKMVTIGNFIGSLYNFEQNDLWEVDQEMDTNNQPEFMNSGRNLMRIDDHPESETLLETIDMYPE
jgi:hypothetical protein